MNNSSFGWERVNLVLVASTLLWFGFGMRIMITPWYWCFGCCWVVLTLSQGLFSVLCSASEELHRKLGGSTAGTADLNWSNCIFHIIECHTQDLNWGQLARRGQEMLKSRLGISQVTSTCSYWASFASLGFYSSLVLLSLPPPPLFLFFSIIFIYYNNKYKLFQLLNYFH